MRSHFKSTIHSLGLVMSFIGQPLAAEEPRGLLLRKGLVIWQVTLNEARRLIEEDIHPNTLVRIRGQKQEAFGCEREAAEGVTRCTWACCVDLGEKDIVHFATLWFYKDRFYAYAVTFNTGQFSRLDSVLTKKFGSPSRETQETRINPAAIMRGGISSYVADTKRWDSENAVVLLSDRGGRGSPLAGQIYVAYLPLARQAVPANKQDSPTVTKLPF